MFRVLVHVGIVALVAVLALDVVISPYPVRAQDGGEAEEQAEEAIEEPTGPPPEPTPTPAAQVPQVTLGGSALTADDLADQNVTRVGVLRSGATYWFKASPGFETQLMAATLQINPWTIDDRGEAVLLLQGRSRENVEPGLVAAFVNFQGRSDLWGGKFEEDAPGFTRVGFLTRTLNTGLDRAFHAIQALTGQSRTVFYKLVNKSKIDVTYAFSVEHNSCQLVPCNDTRAMEPKGLGPLPLP